MSGKRRGGDFKKAQYYVWYLGWKEVRGVWGREFTEPITRELITRRRHDDLPKLTIEVTRKELKINQLIEKKKGKIEKLKYPPIPAKDITYGIQALSPSEDVVSCIYLGFNPQTRCAVHVHVYRCDSPETAEIFAAHLNNLIEIPEHKQRIWKIEADLVVKGQIVPRPSAFVGSAQSEAASTTAETIDDRSDILTTLDRHSHYDDRDHYEERNRYPDDRLPPTEFDRKPPSPEPTIQFEDIYDSVTAELKSKLLGKEIVGPILLPPKDYDTIHRKAGALIDLDEKKPSNIHIIGPHGGIIRVKKDNSGDDSALGDSEEGGREAERLSANWAKEEVKSRGGSSKGGSWKGGSGKGGSGKGSRPGSQHNSHPGSLHNSRPGSFNGQADFGEDEELMAVTPRWKMTSQTYIPPSSPRSASPNVYNASPPRSPRVPRDARPLSPPPELRDSYFPKDKDVLPGYLLGDHMYGAPPSHPGLIRTRGGSGPTSEGNKKYTASTLGLKDKKNGRGRDEGYLSMDRHSDPRVRSAEYMPASDPYGNFTMYAPEPRNGRDMITSMPSGMAGRRPIGYEDPMPDYSTRGPPY